MKAINLNTLIVSLSFLWLGNQKATAQEINKPLHKIFEDYYQEYLKLEPLNATFSGDHRYDDLLDNDGAANYIALKKQFYNKYLQLLKGVNVDKLNEADKISYGVLKQTLDIHLEKYKYHFEYMPINHFASTPLLLGVLGSGSSAQPFKTVNDYKNWFKRINAFTLWVDTAISNMKKGEACGIVLPKVLVLKIIPQMEALAKDDSLNIFYTPIKNLPSTIDSDNRQLLRTTFVSALKTQLFPAYNKLAVFFKDEYLQHATDSAGLSGIPGGKGMYNYYINQYTTTNKSAGEIYQTGLNEVARITALMEQVKQQAGFRGSLHDFFVFMNTDSRFKPFKTPEQVLQAYRNIYAKVQPHLSEFFNHFPQSKFEIKQVEAFRAAGQNGPSYMVGSYLDSRPGIFYVPIVDATKINVTSLGLEATFIHEAVPGHHYQISLQQENKLLPTFRRSISYSVFTEGWGLYCESLGKQLGCYTDPYQQMGALNNEILRAIRLVVDVGIHTGKMNREQAIAYMLKNESVSEADAISATERYMAIPGQALSYKIGELEIIRLRDKCKATLGNKFSISKFHDQLLAQGDMPLQLLDDYMLNWANRQLSY